MQCRFDTAKNCGFIAIPKENTSNDQTSKVDARIFAEQEIKLYNQYVNGEVYAGYLFREQD
jgi:hypothetical protein